MGLFFPAAAAAVALFLIFLRPGAETPRAEFRMGGSGESFPFGVTGRTTLPDGTPVVLRFDEQASFTTTVEKGWFGFLFEGDPTIGRAACPVVTSEV